MASRGDRLLLITGVAGFTGRHVAAALQPAGWEIVGLRAPDSGTEAAVDGVRTFEADLLDRPRLTAWLARERPTHVLHLAASTHVMGDPLGFYRTNVLGTESLLEAIAEAGLTPRKIVLASSANVYGNARHSPLRETDPVCPVNHYAASKAAMEWLAAKWSDRLPLLVTRPFNYTGAGQSEAFLVPKIVAAFHRRAPVLRLGNLDVARDLSDVRFIVEAYRRLLESPITGATLNLCSGRSVPLIRLLDVAEAIAGYRPAIEVDPALVRRDEIRSLCGDPSRLIEAVGAIGVRPLEETLAWMYRALGATDERGG